MAPAVTAAVPQAAEPPARQPQAVAATADFPAIPGIDIGDGLRRMMNKAALYEKVLRDFHTRFSGEPERIRQALAAAGWSEAQGRDAPATAMTAHALDAPQQIGLFATGSAALKALAALDPDELTPKQALEALYRLKSLS